MYVDPNGDDPDELKSVSYRGGIPYVLNDDLEFPRSPMYLQP